MSTSSQSTGSDGGQDEGAAASSKAPSGFFYTDAHWAAIDGVTEALRDGREATLLVGPVGVGKSTVVRQAIEQGPKNIHAVLASAGKGGGDVAAFEKRLAGALGVEDAVTGAKTEAEALRARLAQLASIDQRVALFVDHADRLSDEKLNALAGLIVAGTLEDGRTYGVQIVLAGPPSLQARLLKSGAEAFKSAAMRAFMLRLLRRDEVSKFAAATVGGALELADEALDRIMERTRGAPALLGPLLTRLMADAKARDGAQATAAPTAAAVDTAADALAIDCSPQALGLDIDEVDAADNEDEDQDASRDADRDADQAGAPDEEIVVDLDVDLDVEPDADKPAAVAETPEAAAASASDEAGLDVPADLAFDGAPDDLSDDLSDEALAEELRAIGIDPVGPDDAALGAEEDGDRARPLAALSSDPGAAPANARKAAPKRRRRRGLRLVDPAWIERRKRILKTTGAVVAVAASGVVGVAMVQHLDDGRIAALMSLADETVDAAATVEGPTPADLEALGAELSRDAGETYERNRGVVLDAMDGAFDLAETAARRAAAAAPGAMGEAASEFAALVDTQRETLRIGRALEDIGDLSAEAIEARIVELEAAGAARFAAEQFTRPSGHSAYDAYLEIHRLAPGDRRGENGFDKLLSRYTEMADAALKESAFEEYYRLLKVMERIRARRPA